MGGARDLVLIQLLVIVFIVFKGKSPLFLPFPSKEIKLSFSVYRCVPKHTRFPINELVASMWFLWLLSSFIFTYFFPPLPPFPPPYSLSPMSPVLSALCVMLLYFTPLAHLIIVNIWYSRDMWFLSLLHKNQMKSYVPLCILFLLSLYSDPLLKFFPSFFSTTAC